MEQTADALGDVHRNFIKSMERWFPELDPDNPKHRLKIIGLFLDKQIDAIRSYTNGIPDPEGLRSRIIDARNFLVLMDAAVYEWETHEVSDHT